MRRVGEAAEGRRLLLHRQPVKLGLLSTLPATGYPLLPKTGGIVWLFRPRATTWVFR
jgi:hypothetical protein